MSLILSIASGILFVGGFGFGMSEHPRRKKFGHYIMILSVIILLLGTISWIFGH